ncbi:hypothetical protein K456DRAFT_89157 [Colletotrichum gloeosporioides 23]|nr:hypothetical protein K456DRAFT_89157 [Colletotrichum gloeosporioides 23]
MSAATKPPKDHFNVLFFASAGSFTSRQEIQWDQGEGFGVVFGHSEPRVLAIIPPVSSG